MNWAAGAIVLSLAVVWLGLQVAVWREMRKLRRQQLEGWREYVQYQYHDLKKWEVSDGG